MAAMMTVTNPGDKVIIFLPVLREPTVRIPSCPGAEPIYVPLVPPGFPLDANVP